MTAIRIALFLLAAALSAATHAGTTAPPDNPHCPTGAFRPFIPGFVATPLPVKLTNINNVAYGPDGRLYCAGYDGRIHVLTDTDGDGIEDHSEIFWNKSGDILCPLGMVVNKDGVFVCTQGRIARLRDTNGDGIADECVTVASGWSEKVPGYLNRRVDDCIGLAIDAEGNYYIGLGCANYENPYVLDKETKQPHFDRNHVRGSLLKISADGKNREILATGLRFTVGIEINRHGDLFCTDQEGSTWLPTGNPFDELLHVVKGRHFGFPPRHPQYLPDVFDEPSTVDFGPTHQCTCGFRFNEASATQKLFGSELWNDNVFVTGQSRGKLFRVQLAKTAFGYVGRPTILAAVGMLPTDLTFSPKGEMILACHSGRPDWGNGPGAEGTLFKLKPAAPNVPVPTAVWTSSPLEVRVTFSAPIDPQSVAQVSISGGKYAREGDHIEPFRPGYAVVKLQQASPRHQLTIRGTQLSEDRRELRIATAPHPWDSSYSLSLAPTSPATDAKESFELAYDFHGVEAHWFADGSPEAAWTGWLPHLDLDASRALTRGSQPHDELWKLLQKPGRLVLHTTLTSTWDKTIVLLQSPQNLKLRLDGKDVTAAPARTELPLPATGGALELELPTGGEKPATLSAGFRCDTDSRERPLFLYQQSVPWTPQTPAPVAQKIVEDPQLAGGDSAKGRTLFFGEAKCSSCHTIHGEGANVGPDLSNQSSRQREVIFRDIVEPSATINPDYLAYLVQLKDGRRLEGTLQTFGTEKIKVMDATGNGQELLMSDVKSLKQSKLSFMPEGFKDLGPEKLRDLLAFLTEKK